jgi:hypothetical protein
MRVEVSEAAAEQIRARGGVLYIWSDNSGFLRHGSTAPTFVNEWVDYPLRGIEVKIGTHLTGVKLWRIEVRRFPWRRLEVSSNSVPSYGDSGISGVF